jgi:hypothetical protein
MLHVAEVQPKSMSHKAEELTEGVGRMSPECCWNRMLKLECCRGTQIASSQCPAVHWRDARVKIAEFRGHTEMQSLERGR